MAKKDKEMDFKEFIHRLASVISAGGNTAAFTRSVFEAILSEEGQDILDEYQPSSYKSFYNGQAKITRLARKINAYIEPMNFSDYIYQFTLHFSIRNFLRYMYSRCSYYDKGRKLCY